MISGGPGGTQEPDVKGEVGLGEAEKPPTSRMKDTKKGLKNPNLQLVILNKGFWERK